MCGTQPNISRTSTNAAILHDDLNPVATPRYCRVPCARRQVMESNQVHVVAAAVSRDSQHVIHAVEPRFTREIVGDVGNGNRRNRIDDDVALVHSVPATDLYVRTRPDANAASDSPPPDSLAKA